MDVKKITPENFRNWMPVGIRRDEKSRTLVDWCYMGETRFTDPFFEDTIGKKLRDPFSLLFRFRTPLEYLEELSEALSPVVEPTGFIFHLSRCGSTLISQMLAALTENIVISEAPPIDFIIRERRGDSGASRTERVNNLKCLVNVFGQKRREEEARLFIKFDCWHALDLALVTEAFPAVPWIFLYRDPVEVIVSHLRQPGMQMIPGNIENLLPDANLSNLLRMPREEYCARVLGRICASVLKYAQCRKALMVNYRQLPGAVGSIVARHFKVRFSPQDLAKMNAAARFDAKSPRLSFTPDAREKNRAATDSVRQAAEQFAAPYYEKLEQIRRAATTEIAAA